MRRIAALLLIVIILLPSVALGEWYPFGLTSEDDFQTAREKVKAATGTTYKETGAYINSNPVNYKAFGLKADTFLVNRPTGTKWRVTILLKAELTEYEKVLEIYKDLVQNLGEPISVEPMITEMDFSGITTQTSPFADEDAFLVMAVDNFPSTYSADFGNIDFRIMQSWATGTIVGLYFECPAD